MEATPTYTQDDVARLLSIALERFVTQEAALERVYPIEEVAKITGLSWRYIVDACRENTLEHVRNNGGKNVIGMTRRQISLLVARHTRGGDLRSFPAPADEEAEARSLSRGAARRSPRRVA